jgi:hypothetical protein
VTRRSIGSLMVAVALLVGPGGYLSNPPSVLAACATEEAGADAGTSVNADGAKMAWKARALTATDTGAGGFTAQVMWVGTNNTEETLRWVEAGITKGWQGQNIYTAYTAHGDLIKSPPVYAEHRWSSPTITLGNTYTFAGFYNTTNTYRTTVNAPSNSWDWSGHTSGTSSWSGGSESTCGSTGVVTNTYVSVNQYRRASDHVYVNTSAGSLFDLSPNGGSAWCVAPRTFRYWLNNSTSGCS